MQLRHYQQSAVDKTLEWFADGKEKPLIVLPTGTGKALVQAELCRKILSEHPYVRIICATHSKELVQQNHDEILGIWPQCPAGIYSSGLKRKDRHAQVLFAGIQSIYNKSKKIGHADIVIVDEAHTISRKSDTMWGQFFREAKELNPNIQIIGLTATDYRLDSGNLVPHTFNGVSYEYPIIDAIKEGFLCELISAPTETRFDLSDVGIRGKEFIAGQLEKAFDNDPQTRACIEEIMRHGHDRKSWMIFAAGNKHAKHITEILIENGIDARCVTQETSAEYRDKAVEDHKAGRLKCLVNNMIFTTGYNNKMLDLIAVIRSTMSEGLWVQICGRGMRLYPDKNNCLLLDFGGNIDRHGPIDKIKGKEKPESSGDGEAPLKQCPTCFTPVYAAIRICPECGHEFPPNEIDISTKASSSAIFSTQQKYEFYNVLSANYKRNLGKDGKPDTLMATYNTLSGQIREWICFDHTGYAKTKSMAWAADRGVNNILDLNQALEIKWPKPLQIEAMKDGKYWKVRKAIF